jgi:hypothetical protein
MILFRHVLMNGIVRESSERKFSSGEVYFHLIRARALPDPVEDFAGLFVCQHIDSRVLRAFVTLR